LWFSEESPSSGAVRHLLPDGEKNRGVVPLIPLPVRERVDRPQAETGEGALPPFYRVKLWALPASTLMMLPVDLAEASEAKK